MDSWRHAVRTLSAADFKDSGQPHLGHPPTPSDHGPGTPSQLRLTYPDLLWAVLQVACVQRGSLFSLSSLLAFLYCSCAWCEALYLADGQQAVDRACCCYGTCSAHPAQVLWGCAWIRGHCLVCARVVLSSQLVLARRAALLLLVPGMCTPSSSDWQ